MSELLFPLKRMGGPGCKRCHLLRRRVPQDAAIGNEECTEGPPRPMTVVSRCVLRFLLVA